MEASVEIDRASRRKMEQTLTRFAEVSGKTVEEGIQMIAKSAARKLAERTQRWGLNQGPKARQYIESQVTQVWMGVNFGVYPESGSIKQAHYNARKNGVVPRRWFRKEKKGNKWEWRISEKDRDQYVRQVQKKLGRAKAGWITAGNEVAGPKATKIPRWIQRHVGSTYGNGITTGTGLAVKVTIQNNVPYINSRILPDNEMGAAALFGMKNGFRRIKIIIDKEVEKANRA